jgi:hypothetical protein
MDRYINHQAKMTTLAPRASKGSRVGVGRTAKIAKIAKMLVEKPGLALCIGALVFTLAACGGGSSTTQGPSGSTTPSSGTPTGLPRDWQALAIRAAKGALNTCAQSSSLSQKGCPQSLGTQSFNAIGSQVNAHWTLIGEPLAHAVATVVPESQRLSGSTTSPPVMVSGLYQMQVSYTMLGQGIRPYLDYSGGRADATMSWDGSAFQEVNFGSSAGPTLPPFTRPAGATDAAALSLVRAGFQECVTIPVPTTDGSKYAIPNCPQGWADDRFTTSAQWVLNGDPMQGALVSFDTERGDVTVSGNYAMKLTWVVAAPGNPNYMRNGTYQQVSSGGFTALLVWDGQQLKLLNITLI